MKVLIITASLDEHSGWGRYSRAVIDQLIAQGMDVIVCSENKGNALYSVKQLRPISSLLTIGAYVQNILTVRRASRDADIVHSLDGWPHGTYGFWAVLGTAKPLFMTGIGTYSVAPLYNLGTSWLLRRAYARAKKVFCISDYTKKQIEEAGIDPRKLTTVHVGTSTFPSVSYDEAALSTKQHGIPNEATPVILTVGAIKERKGQMTTLRAVEILRRHMPHVLYVMVGRADAAYRAEIERYVESKQMQNNVLIIQGADDRDLAHLYTRCDVFALNSNTDLIHHHFEGFGLVVVEAGAFGKPAVGSIGSGIEDAIKDGETGFLTRQGDSQDVAEKIDRIMAKYHFFSSNAKLFSTTFNWAHMASAYIRFYKI